MEDPKKLIEKFKDFEKKMNEKGYEDLMRKAKFQSMLQMLTMNDFRHRDLPLIYVLLDEEEPKKYLSKILSFVEMVNENLDEISIKDLREHLLKILRYENESK